MKIRTDYSREWREWFATTEDYCGCPDCHDTKHPVGRGYTEDDAIADLQQRLADQ